MAGLAGLWRALAKVQESNDDRDIVDHALLTRPPVNRLLHEEVDSALGIFLLVEAIHDSHHYLMVGEAVPQTI